jgi:UPF0716 protein FxsA
VLARLFLVFTLVPLAELAILVYLGGRVGIWWTVGAVLAVGLAGALLARSQGIAAVRRVVEALEAGRVPGDELLGAAVVLVGAVLLVTPGFLTDVAALVALLPPTRALVVRALKRRLQARVARLDTPRTP